MASFNPLNPPDPVGAQDEGENGGHDLQQRGLDRAPFQTVGGGGARVGFLEQQEELEVAQRPLLRQRSAPTGDIEMAQLRLLPRRPLLPARLATHTDANSRSQAPWPGENFKVAQLLPGSVYLWACGERDEGDGASPVSPPEVCAAWVVLVTQATCYAGLWKVSGNAPPAEPQPSSLDDGDTEGGPDYSILAIAGAMYLLLTIAAADLWGGCALCLEGIGSGRFVLFTQRRVFGGCLLGTFIALIGASIRVLFYSSSGNAEIVIGAAAVLFIADVDEKAMAVLKSVKGKWRLFWVLEAVGLSFLLAVLAIKVTGNGIRVSRDEIRYRIVIGGGWDCATDTICGNSGYDIDIYTWTFIIYNHPMAVTTCSFLAASIVSNPSSTVKNKCFTVVACAAIILCWSVLSLSPPLSVVAGGGCALIGSIYSYQKLKEHVTYGKRRFRETIDQRPRRYLLRGGLLVIGYVSVCLIFDLSGFGQWFVFGFDLYDLYEVLGAGLKLVLDLWILKGVVAAVRPAISIRRVSFRWFMLGFAFSNLFTGLYWWTMYTLVPTPLHDLAYLMWMLAGGTLLWGEEPGTYGVAFWGAVSLLCNNVLNCVETWFVVWSSGYVK